MKKPGLNEAPRSKLRGISGIASKLTRLRSLSYGAVHLTIHPCSKLQGILAKANKKQAGEGNTLFA